jgi:hypothetical protein
MVSELVTIPIIFVIINRHSYDPRLQHMSRGRCCKKTAINATVNSINIVLCVQTFRFIHNAQILKWDR